MVRNADFRLGDRAEDLGIVLMKMFCAIAPVPRQEDFGIFDAVATLLRRENKSWHAEDSFLVQFKGGASVKKVEYKGEKFKALQNQELALFIAHVNLEKADIKLYSVGVALAEPNIRCAKQLVVHLIKPRKQKPFDGVTLHIAPDPILHWSANDITVEDKETHAYNVMTQWLSFDHRNRRYFKMGLQVKVRWQTNEVPSIKDIIYTGSPSREDLALAEAVPTVEVLSVLAINNIELATPMLQVRNWMRSRGIDLMVPMNDWLLSNTIKDFLFSRLGHDYGADIVVYFEFDVNDPQNYVFREFSCSVSTNNYLEQRHQCSNLDDIRNLGFEAEIDSDTQKIIGISLGEGWLAREGYKLIEKMSDGNVFFLKKVSCSSL